MLKFCSSSLPKSSIAVYLFLQKDSNNHTIPIDGTIALPDDSTSHILIMARMRRADDTPFVTVGEVLEFLQQIFEGVQFMHRHNVAYYDIAMGNLVMDTTELILGGFHPMSRNTQDGVSKPLILRSRTEVAPVKYYFIDFGLSVGYPVLQSSGKVQDVPCDPFKLDIRQIGETIKKEFLEKY
ncbi:hypothetical protein C8J57DRAFT_1512261 [Mycena rebaudengoi]|nr:hypothetical protein C8J57DRAFT_1512261 [Mycena rebaudengoi]